MSDAEQVNLLLQALEIIDKRLSILEDAVRHLGDTSLRQAKLYADIVEMIRRGRFDIGAAVGRE